MTHAVCCKITIIGNSTPLLVQPRRPARDDGTYGEQLERILNESGVPAEVTNRARFFELIQEGGPRYRHQHPGEFPDVLVVHYGMLELQPNVAPTWLVRHLTEVERGGRGLRGLWKRRGTRVVWPQLRRWQRWASQRVGLRTWRLPPDRFGAELRHVIEVARATHALVLVPDVHRPNDRLEHFMPGLEPRWERINGVIRSVVDSFDDPAVRLIEAAKIVDDIGLDAATVDGLHLTPEAHRRTAEEVAAAILDWRKPR